MTIVEFTMDHPVFREPLNRVPDIEIIWEQTYEQLEGPTQMIAWIVSDDFELVEATIEDDPGARNPTVIAEMDDRRLYRVDFTECGRESNLLPEIVAAGGVLREATASNEGWSCRVRMPDRQTFERVYEYGRSHDIDFTFHRLYDEADRVEGDGPALTTPQRETLIEAIESGYLEIPRECSLAELGERLGISESATSERFRRGVKQLIEQTVDA